MARLRVRDRPQLPGQSWILNDPFAGGTHLPDITVITPIHVDDELIGFAKPARFQFARIDEQEPFYGGLVRRRHQPEAFNVRAADAKCPLGDRPLVGAFELRPGDANGQGETDRNRD